MLVLGIDPGARESALVLWDPEKKKIHDAKVFLNDELVKYLRGYVFINSTILGIEQIRGFGVVSGDDTFDTCEWSGRFQEAFESRGGRVIMQPRKTVKRVLCGNTTTNDHYVRMALIDRYGEPGTKRSPGPLYGISGHLWAAVACAATVGDILNEKK